MISSVFLLFDKVFRILCDAADYLTFFVYPTFSFSAVSLAEHHLLVMWSTAFYLLERYADEISDQELKANLLKVQYFYGLLFWSNKALFPLKGKGHDDDDDFGAKSHFLRRFR